MGSKGDAVATTTRARDKNFSDILEFVVVVYVYACGVVLCIDLGYRTGD